MNIKSILGFAFLFYYSSVFSQIKIAGSVTDSLGNPVLFVPVALLSLPDSNLVKGTMTDAVGKYSIDQIDIGSYLLKLSGVGYEEKIVESIKIDSFSKDLTLNVKLLISSQALQEVGVTGMRRLVEIKNGNIIVNVANSPLTKGNSVFDLLAKLPTVSINNNKITVQGRQGVIVMIDDRPQTLSDDQLINLLKSMNADLVSSIEVLKNPPAKYDATGTSGMINIISKKVIVSGFSGTAFSSYSQGFYEQLLSGLSLNYKTKKITFFSNLSGTYGHSRQLETFKNQFTDNFKLLSFDVNRLNKTENATLNYKGGLDWAITNKDVLGGKIEGGPGTNTSWTNGRTFTHGNDNLGFDHLDAKVVQPNKWNLNNFDINYNHRIDTLGSTLSFITDYTLLRETTSSDNQNKFYNSGDLEVLSPNNYRNLNKNHSKVLTGRIDFVKVYNENTSFESGIKVAYTKTFNDYLFEKDYASNGNYLKNDTLSNKFNYTEMTKAGYFNYVRSIRKLSMQLGIRIEQTSLTGADAKNFKLTRTYLNVFPNFSFDYKKNDNHDFQLNLSRRINRPGFSDLNPFISFRDQYTSGQGNPFLLPDYANRAELTYNYKSGFSTSIGYSYTKNIILEYLSQNDSTKVTLFHPKNMKSNTTLEYSVFYQKSFTDRWEFSISGTFAKISCKGDIDGANFHNSGINYYGNLRNNFLVKKNIRLELSGIYIGPNIFGVIQTEPLWMASLGVKSSFFKEKLDLTFGIDDLFHSFIIRSGTNFENQNWSYFSKNDTRRFRISINYKFGKMNIEEREVNMSNEEEKSRLKHTNEE